jgi:hypothetical protein
MASKPEETVSKEKEEKETVVVSRADLRKMNQLIEEKRRDVQKWRECVDGLETALKEKGHELSAALSKVADMEARLLSASRPDANGDSSRIESSSATQQSGLIVSAATGNAPATVRPRVSAPTYVQSTDIHMFLKQMDNYFSLYPLITVEENIAILKSSFDVHTFTILQHIAIPADKLNDYDFLKQACIERFGEATSASERRLQFKTEKQSDSQTFDQFYEHLVKIATRAFAATRDQKEVGHFRSVHWRNEL